MIAPARVGPIMSAALLPNDHLGAQWRAELDQDAPFRDEVGAPGSEAQVVFS